MLSPRVCRPCVYSAHTRANTYNHTPEVSNCSWFLQCTYEGPRQISDSPSQFQAHICLGQLLTSKALPDLPDLALRHLLFQCEDVTVYCSWVYDDPRHVRPDIRHIRGHTLHIAPLINFAIVLVHCLSLLFRRCGSVSSVNYPASMDALRYPEALKVFLDGV
jgi:hypothetical protein